MRQATCTVRSARATPSIVSTASRRPSPWAGTGDSYSGDGGPARLARLAGRGPRVVARSLYVVDTENHVIRAMDLKTGIIQQC